MWYPWWMHTLEKYIFGFIGAVIGAIAALVWAQKA